VVPPTSGSKSKEKLLRIGFLLDLFFDLEGGGDTLL
jgi:hypothetical protein